MTECKSKKKQRTANKGLQQLGVEGKLESWFCTLKFGYKSIHLANQTPTASSPRR